MLIKERILSVIKEGYYGNIIRCRDINELQDGVIESLKEEGIFFTKHDIASLSNKVIPNGEYVIKGIKTSSIKKIELVKYDEAIDEELRLTDLSEVKPCYKKRIIDVIYNRLYNNYKREEVCISIKSVKDISEIINNKIEELSKNKGNVLKYAKNTLRVEDDRVFFTMFC